MSAIRPQIMYKRMNRPTFPGPVPVRPGIDFSAEAATSILPHKLASILVKPAINGRLWEESQECYDRAKWGIPPR